MKGTAEIDFRLITLVHLDALSIAAVPGECDDITGFSGLPIESSLDKNDLAQVVSHIPDSGAGAEWLTQRASFAEGQLTWLGGQTCELWSVREAEFPVITLEDPNLSDLVIPPVDSETSSGDKSVNLPVDLISQDDGEQILGSFVIIDARVLVTSYEVGISGGPLLE